MTPTTEAHELRREPEGVRKNLTHQSCCPRNTRQENKTKEHTGQLWEGDANTTTRRNHLRAREGHFQARLHGFYRGIVVQHRRLLGSLNGLLQFLLRRIHLGPDGSHFWIH